MSLQVYQLQGDELQKSLPELAQLRITVFRDFPYLYEGDLDYEKKYLQVYAKSSECAVIAAYDEGVLIGAATALPLKDESAVVQEPFLRAGMDISSVFYFGESVLLKPYRGRGLGHRFFDEREAVALRSGAFDKTCFCAVQRSSDHSLRPENYQPLDEFWMRRGYRKEPRLVAQFSWRDVGHSEESLKPMMYWVKEWKS